MVEDLKTACQEMESGRMSPEVIAELLESMAQPRARLARVIRAVRSAEWGSLAAEAEDADYAEEAGWADVLDDQGAWGGSSGGGAAAHGTAPPAHVWLPIHEGGAFGDVVLPDEGYRSDQPALAPARTPGLGPVHSHEQTDGHGVFHDVATLQPTMLHAFCGNVSTQ